ncbi:BON domain-containing protein [Luteimonas sp. A501]
MTRSTTGPASEEFRDVARDAMKLGGRCVGAVRDWLGEKREEFNMGRAAGGAGAGAAGAGVTVHGYRGIGPRGYRRDDGRVREDVCDALTDSDALDASDITVTVQDGVVKLAGSVPHRMMKRLAEDLADDCGGVRDVENALRVGPPPSVGAASTTSGASGPSANL